MNHNELALKLAQSALEKAQAKHAPMRGEHEGYAVILEELDELWDEVKAQKIDRNALLKEALHVSAMGLRFVVDVCLSRQDPEVQAWIDAKIPK